MAAMCVAMLAGCAKKESKLEISFPERFDTETVELVSFGDSTLLKSGQLNGGLLTFDNSDLVSGEPQIVQIMIDGRVKGFAVIEPGTARIDDSMSVAQGSPLNDRFTKAIEQLDSVENLNDMIKYVDFAEQAYNDNKDNPLGLYFGVEWMKYAEPQRVDSLLKTVPADFKALPRVQKYAKFAELRARTAPGQKYVDFSAVQPDGQNLALSRLIKPGRYTLVDFWASWCPYCIKELPELAELYERYNDKGLDIIGIAVRDQAEDTQKSIEKHGIKWPVMFNAERKPYDIYGFSGIPHLMLIGPDGTIIARGENAKQTAERLATLLR